MKKNMKEKLTEAAVLGAISAAFIAAGAWMNHTSRLAGISAGMVPFIMGGGFLVVMLISLFREGERL